MKFPHSTSPARLSIAAGRQLRHRMVAGEGFALAAAIIVLMVISLLAAAAVTVSIDTSTSTNQDGNRKAALAAAEAGLKVATYRLTMLDPAPEQCVDSTSVATPVNGYCQTAEAEQTGNGTSFTYTTTEAMNETDKCVGLPVVSQTSLEQRCVTATGTANGVSQRLEARVATYNAKPLFDYPEVGFVGLNGIENNGSNGKIESGLGTNGKAEGNGTGFEQIGPCLFGPSGEAASHGKEGEICKVSTKRTPAEGELVLTSVNPGNAEVDGNCPGEWMEEVEPEGNCDSRIIQGMKRVDGEVYTPPFDEISGASKLQTPQAALESEHVLELKSSGVTLTLGGGIYFFCRLVINGKNATLQLAPGAKTAIFVGSPACPEETSGQLEITGAGAGISNSSAPTNLQIYVYGKGPVKIAGAENATTGLVLYAPEAIVSVNGANGTLEGGIAAKQVKLGGHGFNYKWNPEIEEIEPGVAGSANDYYRTAWGQCTPEGEPSEGC